MRIIQGDSYGHDYLSPDIPSVTGFGARWAYQTTIGGQVLAEGVLTPSEDLTRFRLRLTPNDTALFPIGQGFLTVQVYSVDGKYSQEIQQKLRVKPQAITPPTDGPII